MRVALAFELVFPKEGFVYFSLELYQTAPDQQRVPGIDGVDFSFR